MTNYICNLIVPGAAKSGTSTLHALLSAHPQIEGARPKESQHFSFDELYSGGANAHNSLFEQSPKIRYYLDSSQCYMIHQKALSRIYKDLDSPKAIFLLREPVARVLSHYRWNYRLTVEKSPLMQALNERGEDTGYSFDPLVEMYREHGGYLSLSRYSHWIPRWREALGEENILLIRTEDLKKDQKKIMKLCFDFLEIEDIQIKIGQNRNTTAETVRLPSRYLRAVAKFIPGGLHTSRPYRMLRHLYLGATTPKPPSDLTDAEETFLRAALADDIAFHAALAPT